MSFHTSNSYTSPISYHLRLSSLPGFTRINSYLVFTARLYSSCLPISLSATSHLAVHALTTLSGCMCFSLLISHCWVFTPRPLTPIHTQLKPDIYCLFLRCVITYFDLIPSLPLTSISFSLLSSILNN